MTGYWNYLDNDEIDQINEGRIDKKIKECEMYVATMLSKDVFMDCTSDDDLKDGVFYVFSEDTNEGMEMHFADCNISPLYLLEYPAEYEADVAFNHHYYDEF